MPSFSFSFNSFWLLGMFTARWNATTNPHLHSRTSRCPCPSHLGHPYSCVQCAPIEVQVFHIFPTAFEGKRDVNDAVTLTADRSISAIEVIINESRLKLLFIHLIATVIHQLLLCLPLDALRPLYCTQNTLFILASSSDLGPPGVQMRVRAITKYR